MRGRPRRRSTEERTEAVLELLSGKVSVDPSARRFGVRASTVEGGETRCSRASARRCVRARASRPLSWLWSGTWQSGEGRHAPGDQARAGGAGPQEPPFTAREVSTMSFTTSPGKPTVVQLCKGFGISRQAYYTARKAPRSSRTQDEQRIRRSERRGTKVSAATRFEKIQRVVAPSSPRGAFARSGRTCGVWAQSPRASGSGSGCRP